MIDDRRAFPSTSDSVPAARHHVAALTEDIAEDDRELAELLVTELVTNAVLHAGTPFVLRVVLTSDVLRIEVSDVGGGMPAVRAPSRREPTGRELRLVEALASGWGVRPAVNGPGKLVWFALALEPLAATDAREVATVESPSGGERHSEPVSGPGNVAPGRRGRGVRGSRSRGPRLSTTEVSARREWCVHPDPPERRCRRRRVPHPATPRP